MLFLAPFAKASSESQDQQLHAREKSEKGAREAQRESEEGYGEG